MELPPYTEFVWRIDNISKLATYMEHYSDIFLVGDCEWKVSINPKGYNYGDDDHLSIILWPVDDSSKLSYAKFSFSVVNQINSDGTVIADGEYEFADENGRGFLNFMPVRELINDEGYVVNDTCIVTVRISSCRMLDNSTDYEDGDEDEEEEEDKVNKVKKIMKWLWES